MLSAGAFIAIMVAYFGLVVVAPVAVAGYWWEEKKAGKAVTFLLGLFALLWVSAGCAFFAVDLGPFLAQAF